MIAFCAKVAATLAVAAYLLHTFTAGHCHIVETCAQR